MIQLGTHRVRAGLQVGAALPRDVEAISALLGLAVKDCLPVSKQELRERLGEFEVARAQGGSVVGCAALRGTEDRAELRCLTVHPSWRGAGVGRLLVERVVERALSAGEALFCVSREPAFFESLGFSRLPPDAVPPRPEAYPGGPRRWALIRRRQRARGGVERGVRAARAWTPDGLRTPGDLVALTSDRRGDPVSINTNYRPLRKAH